MEEPLVSVIIPVYRIEDTYLKKGLDSIVNQTYRNLEIILVDDGSPDACGSICDKYAQLDARVIVLHLENGGVSRARNAGIDVATGELIMFFDADDWLELNALESVVPVYLEYKCEMVSWNHYFNYENNLNENIPRAAMPVTVNVYTEEMVRTRLIYDMITPEYDVRYFRTNLGAVRAVWGKLFFTDIIKKNKLYFDPTLKIGEDACFNIDYLKYTNKVVFINHYLNHYRVGNTSANHGFRQDIVEVRLNLLKKYNDQFPKKENIFFTCYTREVLSCVLNCLKKFYSNPKADQKFFNRLNGLKELLNSPEIRSVFNCTSYDKKFLTYNEKLMLTLIRFKMAGVLILAGAFLK